MDPAFARPLQGAVDLRYLDVQAAYRQHAGFVGRSLRRLGVSGADLEDLTQEVFLVAHRRRESYDPEARLTTWLFGIALRVAKRHRRRPWLARERPLLGAEFESVHTHTPECSLALGERRQQLELALSTLRPERRAVLEMFEIEGLALRDIAERTGTPLGTACSRLHAARKDLSRVLRRCGAVAGVTAALMALSIGLAGPGPDPIARPALRPERVWSPSRPALPDRRSTATPATAAAPAPAGAVKLDESPRRALERERKIAPAPAWLIQARAALATDPDRTLSLIRANRDPRAPLSPELVDLTLRALEAQRRASNPAASNR